MQITNPELKFVILDLIKFEDDLNSRGQRVARMTYPKPYFKPTIQLQTKLLANMELGLKTEQGPELIWKSQKEVGGKEVLQVVAERMTDTPLEIEEPELKAIKHYYGEREEIQSCSLETAEELEKIVA